MKITKRDVFWDTVFNV